MIDFLKWFPSKLVTWGKMKITLWLTLHNKIFQHYQTTNLLGNVLSSVQFSHSVMSDSLWPHGLQHARPPCPSPAPRVYPNPCPSSQWCHPAISSSLILSPPTQDWAPLGWTGWISLQSKGLSRVFSNTIVQKHQFFCAQLSSQSNSHIHTWPLVKP